MKRIIFNRESEIIQPLRELIELQNHRTLVLWVIDCSSRILSIFEERYPEDLRPRKAVEAAILWASGEIKMPAAKLAALASHRAATDVQNDSSACAAARAMGHVVGTIHVETHALGLVFYGLTAVVYQSKDNENSELVKNTLDWFYERLKYWETHVDIEPRKWVNFLLREDTVNKELLFRKKQETK